MGLAFRLAAQTERQFQAAVIGLARACGWLVYHTHDSRRSAPGFPDLVLVKGGGELVDLLPLYIK